MTSLTKKINQLFLGLLLVLNSCSTLSLDTTYFSSINNFVFPERIKVSKKFYEDFPYSFVHIKSSNRKEAIFVLGSVSDENVMSWIGQNEQEIQTYHGFLIGSKNLDHNIVIKNKLSFVKELSLLDNWFLSPIKFLASLDNPSIENTPILVDLNKTSKRKVDFLEQKIETDLLQFTKSFEELGITYNEKIYYKNNIEVKSIQKINYFGETLEVNFYYK
jgi:hypothetical protein